MNPSDGGGTDRLLLAYSQGNKAVITDLLARFRPYMRGIIDSPLDDRMRGRLDASDLIQEAQIEVARRMDDYVQRRPMPFRNWLQRTVRQRVAIAWRHHRGAKRRSLSLDQIESGVSSMLRTLTQGGKADGMSNTLERISEVYQDIIFQPVERRADPLEMRGKHRYRWAKFVDELIILSGCHFVSLREHDLTPPLGVAHLAYLPDRHITDHAEVRRAITFLARSPQRHEHLLKRIMDSIEQSVLPRGLGLVLHSVQVSIGEQNELHDKRSSRCKACAVSISENLGEAISCTRYPSLVPGLDSKT